MTKFFSELYGSRNVLRQLIAQQLILRYRRTVLGYLWTLINPLLMMSIMAVVFSTLFKADLKTFTVFLFAGMIPWNFFNSVVTLSGTSLVHNEGLIKKIYLPKALFPLSVAGAALIDSLLSFVSLFVIILALDGKVSPALLVLPLSFLLVLIFATGLGLLMSIATVYFRDLHHLIFIVMQGLFFLTPVFYKREGLAGHAAALVDLNPVTPFIELFRAPLVQGLWPSPSVFLQTTAIAAVALALGIAVFRRYESKVVFRL